VITPEPVETINKRLVDFFGRFENGEPNWRVVWSNDLTEKRMVEYLNGIHLLTPVMAEQPKYWFKDRYVLERLVPVPVQNLSELTSKLSYEPIWVFEDNNQNALPPKWEVIVVLIRTLLDQMLYKKGPYKIPEEEQNTIEAIEHRVDKLQEVLYGNESPITDSLSVGSAVGYGTYKRNDTRFNNNPLKGI
jgi:hypothetical protein